MLLTRLINCDSKLKWTYEAEWRLPSLHTSTFMFWWLFLSYWLNMVIFAAIVLNVLIIYKSVYFLWDFYCRWQKQEAENSLFICSYFLFVCWLINLHTYLFWCVMGGGPGKDHRRNDSFVKTNQVLYGALITVVKGFSLGQRINLVTDGWSWKDNLSRFSCKLQLSASQEICV